MARGLPLAPSHVFRALPTPAHLATRLAAAGGSRWRRVPDSGLVRRLADRYHLSGGRRHRDLLVDPRRWIVLLFHPAGHDEPHSLKADSEIRLARPDGTSLYVERYIIRAL